MHYIITYCRFHGSEIIVFYMLYNGILNYPSLVDKIKRQYF